MYALWQGVVAHDRLIRGFKVFVYVDHKNNIYTEALLDNRRIAKKMLNWALELQQFNIVRVWIRGEANILADAPSRAPWENALAQHLPLADAPLRELITRMYREPEAFEADVAANRVKRGLPDKWIPIDASEPKPVVLDQVKDGMVTPDFNFTPEFGRTPGGSVGPSEPCEVAKVLRTVELELCTDGGRWSHWVLPVWSRVATVATLH